MAATIDPLPGCEWNAEAAAADALNRVPKEAHFFSCWITEDGVLHYSKAGTTLSDLSFMATFIQSLVTKELISDS